MTGEWPPITAADLRRVQAGGGAHTPDSGALLAEMEADAQRMDDTTERTEPDYA